MRRFGISLPSLHHEIDTKFNVKSGSGLPSRLRTAIARAEQSHNDENRNHYPREPGLIASVNARRFATVVPVVIDGRYSFLPPEIHKGVGQQSKTHDQYRGSKRQHKQREFEERLCPCGSVSKKFCGTQGPT
jgi:hypothetical protein